MAYHKKQGTGGKKQSFRNRFKNALRDGGDCWTAFYVALMSLKFEKRKQDAKNKNSKRTAKV